jgi:hypothetical protein
LTTLMSAMVDGCVGVMMFCPVCLRYVRGKMKND